MQEFNKDYQRYYQEISKIIKRKKDVFKQELTDLKIKEALLQHQDEVGNVSQIKNKAKFLENIEMSISKQDIMQYKKNIEDRYVGSGMFMTMAFYIVLMFLKGMFAGNYLVNYYIDSIVALFALIVAGTQLKKEYDILKKYKLQLKPLIIEIVGMLVSVVIVILMSKSPFDVTFIIVVVAMITNKKLFIQQWNSL